VTFYGTTIDVWKKGTPGTLDAEVDNNSASICSSIFASIPVSSTVYEYSIGGMGIQQLRKTTPGQCMAYSQPGTPNVIQTWPAGAQIYPVEKCLYGVTCAPRMAEVLKWGWLNGAFMTDIGVPTAARATYRTPALNGTKRDLYVRPFTKAVAMHVLGDTSNDSGANDFPVRSGVTINFESAGWCSGTGCRLYPLMTDGYTSNAVCPSATRTSDGGCTGYAPFRAGDGQVFMREPIQ
jgi:hypothetical protein